LLQPLQFKSPLHELRGENRIALWNFLCATTAAEVFGIMFEHQHASCESNAVTGDQQPA
jgi:hypothetical protein